LPRALPLAHQADVKYDGLEPGIVHRLDTYRRTALAAEKRPVIVAVIGSISLA
jgi:hypothetical protein